MESASFYVTLPSNASMDIYPNNTKSNFQVRLPRTLYLNSRYEVALSEIQYPVSWHTFAHADSYQFLISMMADKEDPHIQAMFFPKAYYKTMHELVQKINDNLFAHFLLNNREGNEAILYVHEVEEKIEIITKRGAAVKFPNEVADVLGLDHNTYYRGKHWAPHRYDITRGFNAMYVNCNVCSPQIVGDVYAPLLRCVPVQGERGEHVMKTYSDPHYIPVADRQVDVIEINIRDDTGALVPFTSGKVVCKLHFRQRTL